MKYFNKLALLSQEAAIVLECCSLTEKNLIDLENQNSLKKGSRKKLLYSRKFYWKKYCLARARSLESPVQLVPDLSAKKLCKKKTKI